MLFDLSIDLRLCHDLSKVVAPTPRSGAYETWVVPTDQTHGHPQQVGLASRRPADLTVGPTDLVGSPHDLLKTFLKVHLGH
jgi:hypothetical protein